ncbi:Asp23/Gls24 family envelope stress response protein [Deinococcus lacus]|uniref:Asp23/Gls24 family envelope stress response protein n=1 Tax=Deinococcus lacus TaxID=392561 RepID=A0ABW1Y9L8_9DEIO
MDNIEISTNVLKEIATTTIEGIAGARLAAAPLNVGEVLRTKQATRRPQALRMTRDGNSVTVDLGLDIEYGRNLVAVSRAAQREICENIELMSGLKVRAVNVAVVNVVLPAERGTL